MNAGFLNLFRIEEIRKKIFITLGLLFVYRIGFQIPLPGVNYDALMTWGDKLQGKGVSTIVGLMSTLSGGNLKAPALFSLGILPYITASIIMSLLVKTIPSLEALQKEGPSGQKKINQYGRLLTVPLCVFQGFAISMTIFKNMQIEGGVIPSYGPMFVISAILAMTAGTVFLMWLGEQITEYGIGNGASLLITAGIIANIPQAFQVILERAMDERAYILTVAVLAAMYLAIVIGVVYMTKGQRRIPMQQAKQMRGRRMVGGQRHYLPVKLNMANVMPVIFASSLLVLPSTIIGWMSQSPGGSGGFLSYGGWWWITIEAGLIFFFAFFWTSMMFQPTEMANNLKEYGSFVPGIRPGKKTAEFLEKVMVRVTVVGATFLVVIAILPVLLTKIMDVQFIVAQFLGGTGILIVVGVSLDMVDKLNSSLLMRNYEGFMSGGSSKKGRR